jgi:hypothetical protein
MKRLLTSLNVLLCFIVFVLLTTAPLSARGIRELQSNHTVHVSSGWNLMSLPASVSNGDKDTLFPSAVSPAYVFQGATGYQIRDTLQNGVGFWLKFDSTETVSIQGDVTLEDNIQVQAGWNIIGSLSEPIAVNAIQTEPSGIISGQIYKYIPGAGYQQADTLYPGFGYWVRVNQDGLVVLPRLWKSTTDFYSETADIDLIVQTLFGPHYRVADWNDMVAYSSTHSMDAWADSLGMNLGGFLVKSGGNRWWGGNRHYFVERHNHVVPPGWLVHGHIDNHLIDLGSWYSMSLRILCVRTN